MQPSSLAWGPTITTHSVPIYRSYSFLKKIPKYKTPAKFGERFVRFVDIFHKQI
jgi:hypothetical protein